jgi:hypothetical protein
MARIKPNIDVLSKVGNKYRQDFKELVLKVNTDTFLYETNPTDLELTNGIFFRLYLRDKKFIEETLIVDIPSDYIDVSLFGVRQAKTRYNVEVDGNDIVITFNENITRIPQDVNVTDFKIKGKITEVA